MRSEESTPELTIIIPTFNEVEALPLLLADLAGQTGGVAFEVVISDGGSSDGTGELGTQLLAIHGLPGRVLTGPAGRGRQLNRGAARAHGEWLLFLHADSRLPAQTALADGLEIMGGAGTPRQAGRFCLRFAIAGPERDPGYYQCEVKARLDLPGTIHGDQGFWLLRSFFLELGGFREDLPVFEDTLLADAIRKRAEWQLLPATLVTSPRRFQAEGYRERQTLNALLANFAVIGWDAPLQRAPQLYPSQDRARRLQLAPFFRLVDELLDELPLGDRWRIWCRTGGFVRDNAWQLALQRVARHGFDTGLSPDAVPLEPVLRFRRRFDALTDHPPGRLVAALLTWLWFRTRTRSTVQGA